MNYKRLGDYIQLMDERNKDLVVTNLLGINIFKNFMPSVANVSGTDLSKYKVIRKGQFAYSAMQVGRDETIRLALYTDDEPAIISPAYLVIESIDENILIPEYMMMWFQRPESDRYGWFISDSSVRASLDWERFCDINIPIPHIEEQKKYVAIYKSLLNNQKVYEDSLDALQLICDTYIEDLIKTEEPKTLGIYVEKLDEKNRDNSISAVIGISEKKEFRTPSGKVNKKNLTNHFIVRKNEFAYIPRMNPFKPLAAALSHNDYPVLLSPSYVAFKVKKTNLLLSEYLFLFLRRSEFDRYAAFNAWSSTRDTFDWPDMCNVKLPIPSIEKQKAIVIIYHALEARKKINQKLKDSIKPLCAVLMRGTVEGMVNKTKKEYAV
jgi:type I restriction enzyme, S subunit